MNEIERKFLVCSNEWKHSVAATWHLVQGYLSVASGSSQEVRVRIKTPVSSPNSASCAEPQAVMTIKSTGDVVRQEEEFPIDPEQARRLLAMSISAPIHKIRHQVPYGNHTFEVDVYEGLLAGLVVAEVELSHSQELVDLPSWVGQEVTSDAHYKNAALSQNPPVASTPGLPRRRSS